VFKNVLGLLVAAVGVGLVVWLLVGSTGLVLPDPSGQSDEQIQEFLASDAFKEMDADARQTYLKALRELPEDRRRKVFRMEGASEETRSRARQNMRETQQEDSRRQMEEFFKLGPGEQTAFLDARIDEMEVRRKEWETRRARAEASGETREERTRKEGPPGGRRDGRKFDPDAAERRMQQRLSDSSPEERAQRRVFFTRLMERYRQRFPDRQMPFGGGRGGPR